jgi:phage protein U
MARPLFQLGTFQFDLPNGVPQTLERVADYRWESQDRLLRDPALQFLGPGGQQITLDGVLYPGFSGRRSTLDQLRAIAEKGQPVALTDGLGKIYGKWAIISLREGLSTFAPGGGARQITFSVQLGRYVEDNPGQAASPLSVAFNSAAPLTTTGALPSFVGAGSAFDAASWVSQAANTDVVTAATGAGFGLGQLATVARSIANQDYVGAALGAFGLSSLSTSQRGVWGQLGINAAQMLQQVATGRGAPSMSVALQALQPATTSMLNTLGGGTGGGTALRDLLGSVATISTMLDVDPFITDTVRQAIQP